MTLFANADQAVQVNAGVLGVFALSRSDSGGAEGRGLGARARLSRKQEAALLKRLYWVGGLAALLAEVSQFATQAAGDEPSAYRTRETGDEQGKQELVLLVCQAARALVQALGALVGQEAVQLMLRNAPVLMAALAGARTTVGASKSVTPALLKAPELAEDRVRGFELARALPVYEACGDASSLATLRAAHEACHAANGALAALGLGVPGGKGVGG